MEITTVVLYKAEIASGFLLFMLRSCGPFFIFAQVCSSVVLMKALQESLAQPISLTIKIDSKSKLT